MIDNETLTEPTALARFEAVFLTCAAIDAAEAPRNLPKAIHEYVSRGGTLYASDLRFDTVAEAFPEFVDRAAIAQGISQDLRAEVTSPELRDLLGPEIVLHFGEKGWRPAAFRGDDVSILLQGQLNTTAGASISAPLLVRFPVGKGTVLFTSFHREGRVSDDESKLLQFLVLKAVTSAPESAPDGDPGRRRFLAPGGCGRRGCSRRPGPSPRLSEREGRPPPVPLAARPDRRPAPSGGHRPQRQNDDQAG